MLAHLEVGLIKSFPGGSEQEVAGAPLRIASAPLCTKREQSSVWAEEALLPLVCIGPQNPAFPF